MKVAGFNYGGVFENATWLMGLESFSFALHDQPELVEAICQRVVLIDRGRKALDESKCIVVLWSQKSVNSENG